MLFRSAIPSHAAGTFLHEIAFHTYAEYIDRVRLPRYAPAEEQIFRFEPHYALSRSYCQRIRTPARIPVLEALKFVPPGETTKEENALYKLIVGSLLRCTCPENCSNPLLFKSLQTRSGSAEKPGSWCWRLTWKARRAELEVLARRGEEKTERARRVPCIHDTTVARGWLPHVASTTVTPLSHVASCEETPAPLPLLLRATLAQYSAARFHIIWPDGFATLLQFLGIATTHPDQLTLAEFSALRTRRLVQNLDMMAIARTVELDAKSKAADAEDTNDDANESGKNASGIQSEFVGGEHDIEDEAGINEEDFLQSAPNRLAKMTLDAATGILRRDAEIAAAKKKGRHREAHMQMKAFAAKFESALAAALPPLSCEHADAPPRLLGANAQEALAHQQAVRNAMKKDQEDLRSSVDTPTNQEDLEAALATLKNLQHQEAEATCVTISLPERL